MGRTHDCYADSMSRSQIKFMGFTLVFHVHPISPDHTSKSWDSVAGDMAVLQTAALFYLTYSAILSTFINILILSIIELLIYTGFLVLLNVNLSVTMNRTDDCYTDSMSRSQIHWIHR